MVILDEDSTRALERILDGLGAEHQLVHQGDPRPVTRHQIMDQLTAVLSGTGYCQIGATVHGVGRGSLMVISAGVGHSFACTSVQAMEIVHLHVPRDVIEWDREVLEEESEVLRNYAAEDLPME